MIKKTFTIYIGILFLMLFFPFVSADYEWGSWGGDFPLAFQSQPLGAFANFSNGINTSSMIQGYQVGTPIPSAMKYQPLVSKINGSDAKEYLVFPNLNYLQVYSDTLVLQDEIITGDAISQIDIHDFDGDGNNEIAGIFKNNDTSYSFQIYDFAPALTLLYEKNYIYNATTTIAGVKCRSAECYFYSFYGGLSTLNTVNMTSSSSYTLPTFLGEPIAPPSFTQFDTDGDLDFLIVSKNQIAVFDDSISHGYQFIYNSSQVGNYGFTDAIMFHPDASSVWKVAYMVKNDAGGGFENLYVGVIKSDGTILWSDGLHVPTGSSDDVYSGGLAISEDYNDDNLDDIYAVGIKTFNARTRYVVYRGYDGNKLSYLENTVTNGGDNSLTIADLNKDGKQDFIFRSGTNLRFMNPVTNTLINTTQGVSGSTKSCIPADLIFDGSLEVICSGTGTTKMFTTPYANTNPTISLVSFNPSVSVEVEQPVSATITASDSESDTIYYRYKCDDLDVWSEKNTNNVKTCTYFDVGTYNFQVGVRDVYHSTYNSFSQIITVSESGVPSNDTPLVSSSVEGSLALPSQLVNPLDRNQGLLPEIYYGTLAFMSSVLAPLIGLIFFILSMMIILTFGLMIKKIAKKSMT